MTEAPCPPPEQSEAAAAAARSPDEAFDLQHVLREVTRGQTRALMIEHLARRLLVEFVQHGEQKPKMLLRLPNGGPFAADLDDVLELNAELLTIASKARARVQQLLRSRVTVPLGSPTTSPVAPSVDPAEGVVETATARTRPGTPGEKWKL